MGVTEEVGLDRAVAEAATRVQRISPALHEMLGYVRGELSGEKGGIMPDVTACSVYEVGEEDRVKLKPATDQVKLAGSEMSLKSAKGEYLCQDRRLVIAHREGSQFA